MTKETIALFGLLCALGALSTLLASMYFTGARRRSMKRLNLIARRRGPEGDVALEAESSAFLKSFQRLRRRWGIGSRGEADLQGRLQFCGYRNAQAAEIFLAIRTLVPAVMLFAAALMPGQKQLWAVALPGLTYLAPDLILRKLTQRKRLRIASGLADAVDLLVICVDAGLGIDQALARVSQEIEAVYPDISTELILVNLEQRAGKARLQAWQDLGDRVALEEVSSFVGMLVQTEQFGTPIAKALREFAASMRSQRARKAEEQAAKVTIKILFPLAFFIFPSIFIILLGPAALSLMKNFTGIAK